MEYKFDVVLPGTRIIGEVARFSNTESDAFDPNFNVSEEEESYLAPNSAEWREALWQSIYEYLTTEIGIPDEIAEKVAELATEYYPWLNCDIVVWKD